jgi:hypothetical protein
MCNKILLMEICKLQGTKIYQFHINVHQLQKNYNWKIERIKIRLFFKPFQKFCPNFYILYIQNNWKVWQMVENVSIGCLHTTMTLYGCHNDNFSCIP